MGGLSAALLRGGLGPIARAAFQQAPCIRSVSLSGAASMAAKPLLLSLVFVCGFVCGFAGFTLSPARAPLQTKFGLDPRWRGRALAEKLREVRLEMLWEGGPASFLHDVKVLPASSAPPKQLEPGVDQPREDEKEKESRNELLVPRAASAINCPCNESWRRHGIRGLFCSNFGYFFLACGCHHWGSWS